MNEAVQYQIKKEEREGREVLVYVPSMQTLFWDRGCVDLTADCLAGMDEAVQFLVKKENEALNCNGGWNHSSTWQVMPEFQLLRGPRSVPALRTN